MAPTWEAIERFAFDEPGVDFPFEQRLARENGKSLDYARRVIQEYRRFIYLSTLGGGEAAFVRINRRNTWLLRKPPLRLPIFVFLLSTTTLLTACTLDLSDKGFMYWVKVVIGFVCVYWFGRFLLWLGSGRGGPGSGCSSIGGCSGCGGCGGD